MNHIGFVAGLAGGFWYFPSPFWHLLWAVTDVSQGWIRCYVLG